MTIELIEEESHVTVTGRRGICRLYNRTNGRREAFDVSSVDLQGEPGTTGTRLGNACLLVRYTAQDSIGRLRRGR